MRNPFRRRPPSPAPPASAIVEAVAEQDGDFWFGMIRWGTMTLWSSTVPYSEPKGAIDHALEHFTMWLCDEMDVSRWGSDYKGRIARALAVQSQAGTREPQRLAEREAERQQLVNDMRSRKPGDFKMVGPSR